MEVLSTNTCLSINNDIANVFNNKNSKLEKMISSYKLFMKMFSLKNIKNTYLNKISKKATRGIDKVGLKQFNEIKDREFSIILDKCKNKTYKFSPYVEKLQSKGRGKSPRVISAPTIRDKVTLDIIKEILHEIFPECVSRKLPNNYVREIIQFYNITKSDHLCYFKTDIKSFYDSINHNLLLNQIKTKVKSRKLLHLIKSCLQTPTVPLNYKRKDKKNT